MLLYFLLLFILIQHLFISLMCFINHVLDLDLHLSASCFSCFQFSFHILKLTLLLGVFPAAPLSLSSHIFCRPLFLFSMSWSSDYTSRYFLSTWVFSTCLSLILFSRWSFSLTTFIKCFSECYKSTPLRSDGVSLFSWFFFLVSQCYNSSKNLNVFEFFLVDTEWLMAVNIKAANKQTLGLKMELYSAYL